jgi:serine protease AprX
LGRPVYESYRQDPLCQAVEAAWKAGIVVVAAAGNDGRDNTGGRQGYATIDAPGNDPYVITVGAMKTMGTYAREDDLIASYSSKGPTALDHVVKPDLVAPGNLVVSTMGNGNLYLPATYPQNSLGKNYFRLSGTSMAAPVVAGAAALLLEQNPSLTPDQIKARLMKTATKTFPATSCATDPQTGLTYCSVYDLFTVGAGYLDINAAMTSTDIAAKPALSPAVTLNPATGTVSLVQDSPSVWDSSAIWGSSVVWGGRGISGASVVWGGRTVWGDSLLDGFRTVWSDSVVWGGIHSAATSIWGEN